MIDYKAALAEVQARHKASHVDAFDWVTDDADPLLADVYARRAELWQAPIIWGDPLLASNRLLSAHETEIASGTAYVLLSFDPRVAGAPEILDFVARQIVLQWESSKGDGAPLAAWCARLRLGNLSDHRRLQRLPDCIANGYAIFGTSTAITLAHLPDQEMRFNRLPVFAQREAEGGVMPVPAQLWPDALRDWWTAEPTTED